MAGGPKYSQITPASIEQNEQMRVLEGVGWDTIPCFFALETFSVNRDKRNSYYADYVFEWWTGYFVHQ